MATPQFPRLPEKSLIRVLHVKTALLFPFVAKIHIEMTFLVLILHFRASVVTGTVYSDGNDKTKLRLKENSSMISDFCVVF